MGRSHDAHVAQVRDAVLAYVRDRPDAADTALGIVRWWLPRGLGEIGMDRIEAVLEALVASGALRCTRLPDGRLLYRAGTAGAGTHGEGSG